MLHTVETNATVYAFKKSDKISSLYNMLTNSNRFKNFYNIKLQMEGDLTPSQFENVLKLCDILAIQDFSVATLILKQCDWNLQRAIGVQDSSVPQLKQNKQKQQQKVVVPSVVKPAQTKSTSEPQRVPAQPIKKQQKFQQHQPINQHNNQQNENNEFYYDEQQMAYDYNLDEYYQQQAEQEYYKKQQQKYYDIENKKRNFNLGFTSMPLCKTKSQIMDYKDNNQKRIYLDRQICRDYSNHRFDYQSNLLQRSKMLCSRILQSKSPQMRRVYDSLKKNENNKQFLKHLHRKYSSRINFTFGTFLLNLARSYLDEKFLLVYIHKSQLQNSKAVRMLLSQKQIAKFINKHCVSYGMFDSHDDYQILQKYVSLKELPNFALFKFNKTNMKQQLINSYPVLQAEPHNFLEWLAINIGVSLKPNQNIPKSTLISEEQALKRIEMSSIIESQNNQYEQMAKMFELKRQKSQARKVSIELFEQKIESLKQKFKEEPIHETGITIQMRFRLPMSGNSILRNFKLKDKVNEMFEFVHCFGRDQFEQRLAEFDLTQTFPKLSLIDKKQMLIEQAFPDSERQNLIVKEL